MVLAAPPSIDDLLNRASMSPSPPPPSSHRSSSPLPNQAPNDEEDSSVGSDGLREGSTTSAPSHSRKRPADDLEQFAKSHGRNVRLKGDAQEDLRKFSALTLEQQMVWVAARFLAQETKLDSMQVESVYQIPPKLDDRIETYTFLMLVSPSISAYVTNDGPVKSLIKHLEKTPSWGLTAEVQSNKHKKRKLVCVQFPRRAGSNPIQLRQSVSAPVMDIVALCEAVLALGEKVSTAKPSIQLAARFAFLHNVYCTNMDTQTKKVGDNYWNLVDAKLEEIRNTKGPDVDKISQAFGIILWEDRKVFGNISLTELPATSTDAFDGDNDDDDT
ncbi:hypothetical protein BC835DRAFT_1419177 [Cytidiella melzeri]|nr:hypothetical protein BC835DRAFT_1419177 [Cytidiella melzeri]